ncbi:hypothetical protein DY000_02043779 [Brassica cretica]|uniref:Uncharacterized protein n=1 Tax=Brassica cretica TaxID=69181 RepID=A0ABQ7BBB0_BRACR|nr:hypothetical protein DY000_02043779 [Brassica cretica]
MNLSLSGSGWHVLPVLDPPLSGVNDTSDGKGVDDRLFKGSAMTKHGAFTWLRCWSLFTSMIRDQDCEYEVVDDDDEYDDNTPE